MTSKERETSWIKEGITLDVKKFPKRFGGSNSEKNLQKHYLEEMQEYCDESGTEAFPVNTKAFVGSIPMVSILSIVCIALFWINYFTNKLWLQFLILILCSFTFAVYVIEYLLYRKIIDPFFVEHKSHNSWCTIKAKKETKKRVILVAHTDGAFEMPFFLRGSLLFMGLLVGMVQIGLIYGFIVGILQIFHSTNTSFYHMLTYIYTVFLPFFFLMSFFINFKVISDGANDNLSGCYALMGVLKEIREEKQYDNMDVTILFSGSEESGLRGAEYFAKTHKSETKGVDTIVIAVDTLHDFNELQIYTKGINGTQRNSAQVSSLLRNACNSLGYKIPDAGVYPGANDAEAFSREGWKSVGLCGIDQKPKSYYHTRKDQPDTISEECISKSIDILKKTIDDFYHNGLPPVERKEKRRLLNKIKEQGKIIEERSKNHRKK